MFQIDVGNLPMDLVNQICLYTGKFRLINDKLMSLIEKDRYNEVEKTLTNNIILRKLKIALDLKDVDVLDMLDLAGIKFGKHELSAFFRKPSQKQYRLCKDQFLRNFLYGMELKYRKE